MADPQYVVFKNSRAYEKGLGYKDYQPASFAQAHQDAVELSRENQVGFHVCRYVPLIQNLVPSVEGLLADAHFEVWHVDFGWQDKRNFVGSMELVFQALARNPQFKPYPVDKRVKIRWLNDYIKFVPVTKQRIALKVLYCQKYDLITLDELLLLAAVLRVEKEINSQTASS